MRARKVGSQAGILVDREGPSPKVTLGPGPTPGQLRPWGSLSPARHFSRQQRRRQKKLSSRGQGGSYLERRAISSHASSKPLAALSRSPPSHCLWRMVLRTAAVYVVCAFGSLLAGSEQAPLVLRTIQSFCSGILSVLMFVTVAAALPPGPARNVGLAAFAFASTAPVALNALGAFVTERFGWRGHAGGAGMRRRETGRPSTSSGGSLSRCRIASECESLLLRFAHR
jgi:hypothetical protein